MLVPELSVPLVPFGSAVAETHSPQHWRLPMSRWQSWPLLHCVHQCLRSSRRVLQIGLAILSATLRSRDPKYSRDPNASEFCLNATWEFIPPSSSKIYDVTAVDLVVLQIRDMYVYIIEPWQKKVSSKLQSKHIRIRVHFRFQEILQGKSGTALIMAGQPTPPNVPPPPEIRV